MDGYLGEIRMFAGGYAPENWALCNGALLTIQGNEALYSILGTVYGGNGTTNFALPDLRGRLAVHAGQGPNMTENHPRGQSFGAEQVTIVEATMPPHNHPFYAYPQPATLEVPTGNMLATNVPVSATAFTGMYNTTPFTTTPAPNFMTMASQMISAEGGNQAHANIMPGLVINFIIALQGNYPVKP